MQKASCCEILSHRLKYHRLINVVLSILLSVCVFTLCVMVLTDGDAFGLRTSKACQNEIYDQPILCQDHTNSLNCLLKFFHLYLLIHLFACWTPLLLSGHCISDYGFKVVCKFKKLGSCECVCISSKAFLKYIKKTLKYLE